MSYAVGHFSWEPVIEKCLNGNVGFLAYPVNEILKRSRFIALMQTPSAANQTFGFAPKWCLKHFWHAGGRLACTGSVDCSSYHSLYLLSVELSTHYRFAVQDDLSGTAQPW